MLALENMKCELIWNILIFFILAFAVRAQYVQMVISSSVLQVQQLSEYTFTINMYDITQVPAGTTIVVDFPNDFQSQTLKNYDCQTTSWPQSNLSLSCLLENRQLRVIGGFPNDINQQDLSLSFTISNIKNPLVSGQTGSIQAKIISSSNIKVGQTGVFGASTLIFTSGALNLQTSISPTTVNKMSTLTVTVTTKHRIPKQGYLNLRFDTFWKSNAQNVSQVISDSSLCFPNENVSPNVRCSISSGTSQFINLFVKGLFSSDFTGRFSFTIFPFLNAPTTAPQGSFQLTSYNSESGNRKIDSVSNQYISGFTTNQISSATITLKSYIVSSESQALIKCYINNLLSAGDKMLIQFPAQLKLTNLTSVTVNNYAGTEVAVSSKNLLSFRNLTLNTPGTVQFLIKNIILPDYAITLSAFSILTQRNSYSMDYIAEPFTLKVIQGSLAATMSAVSLQLGVFTDYRLQIVLDHPGYQAGVITVEFGPSQYVFTNTSTNLTCISSKKSGCIVIIINSNTLKFGNVFIDQTFSLSLTIKNIKNPLKIGASTSLIITSYKLIDSTQYTVDQSQQNNTFITLVGRKMSIAQISITSTSNITNQVCELTFNIENKNFIPSGSYIEIQVPSQLILPSTIVCNLACNIINVPTNKVKVQLSKQYNEGSLEKITFFNLKNPVNTAPTKSFGVKIYNSNDEAIQYRTATDGGVTYIALQAKQLSLSIYRNSTKNSDSPVLYTFEVNLPFQVSNGVMRIQVPKQIQCLLLCSKSYLNSSHYLISQLISTTNKLLSLNKTFKNHLSVQPMQLSLTYMTQNQLYLYGKASTYVTNNIISELTLDVSWSNQQLLGKGSIYLKNVYLSDSYQGILTISVNFGYDFDLGQASSTFTVKSKTSNEIVIQTNTNQTLSKTIQIQNIGFPSSSPSLPVYITVRTQSNYLVSKSLSFIWTTFCSLPCKTCSLSNFSQCQSCYSNQSLVQGYVTYQPLAFGCVKQCGDKYYPNKTDNKCYQCDRKCGNCRQLEKCLSCPSNSYLLKQQQKCYELKCPIGYFIYYNQCKLCTSSLNCKTCIDSISCDSCVNAYYYYQKKCLSNCPLTVTVQNSYTNNCDSCPLNCTKCIKRINSTNNIQCTQCNSGHYLDNGGCYQSCRTPGLVPESQNCVRCHQTCLTCSLNKYNCLSCSSVTKFKYFYLNKCLINCPNGLYQSQTQPCTCLPCTNPCQYCGNSSINSCQSCILNYSLIAIGSRCESTCPTMYYTHNGNCLPCVGPCKSCLNEVICWTCVTGYSLYVDRCLSQCPQSHISISQNCLKCSSNCKTCLSAINYCTSCLINMYSHQGQCIQPCPTKYYKNQTFMICSSCHYSCKQCLNINYCTKCQQGYQLSLTDNQCVNTCQVGSIPVTGICTSCHSNCTICQQRTDYCTQCANGYYFLYAQHKCLFRCPQPNVQYANTKTCTKSCSQGYYQQHINQTFSQDNNITTRSQQFIYCKGCPPLCKSCLSDSLCTQCLVNAYKHQKICWEECPIEAQYQFNSTCRTCNVAGCYQCSGTQCLQCQTTLLLIGNNLCIKQCSSTQFYNFTSKLCQLVFPQTNITRNQTSSTNQTNSANNTITQPISYKMRLNFVPFPYLILAVLTLLFALILHFSSRILVILLTSSLLGIIVTLCALTTFIVNLVTSSQSYHTIQTNQIIFLALMIIGILTIYTLNIITSIMYHLRVQHSHERWSKFTSTIVILSGTLINFSSYQILNSKLYNFVSLNNPQNSYFWTFYNKLSRISFIAYLCFIISSIILVFSLSQSSYLYYSCVELVVLSFLMISIILANQIWQVDYSLSQTQSYLKNDSFNKLNQFSNQKNLNQDLQSTTTIHAQTQGSPKKIRKQSSNEEDKMKRTKSQLLNNKRLAFNEVVPVEHIKQGLQKGVFRQQYEQIKRLQKQNKELSLLSSASKMNKFKSSQLKLQSGQFKQPNQAKSKQQAKASQNAINIFDLQDEQVQQQNIKKVQKPQSPSKSRRVSRQAQKSSQSKLRVLQNQNVRICDNTRQYDYQQEEVSQQNQNSKEQLQAVRYDDQISQKQPYFYNPNIIFQDADEDGSALQNQTKISESTQKDDGEDVSIYKSQTNRSQKALILKVQKVKPFKQKTINPNLITDAKAAVPSYDQSEGLPEHYEQTERQLRDNNYKTNINKLLNKQRNVFQMEDDLGAYQIQSYAEQIKNINLDNPIKREILNDDLESIVTASGQDYRKQQNQQLLKFSFQQPVGIQKKNRELGNQNNIVEDIEEFDEDNQRPSANFKPAVRNLLSNMYDPLPKGLSFKRRQKKVQNQNRVKNKK